MKGTQEFLTNLIGMNNVCYPGISEELQLAEKRMSAIIGRSGKTNEIR